MIFGLSQGSNPQAYMFLAKFGPRELIYVVNFSTDAEIKFKSIYNYFEIICFFKNSIKSTCCEIDQDSCSVRKILWQLSLSHTGKDSFTDLSTDFVDRWKTLRPGAGLAVLVKVKP